MCYPKLKTLQPDTEIDKLNGKVFNAFRMSKMTLSTVTFFSRQSPNFIVFISFFFLSPNRLSWSVLVPCLKPRHPQHYILILCPGND